MRSAATALLFFCCACASNDGSTHDGSAAVDSGSGAPDGAPTAWNAGIERCAPGGTDEDADGRVDEDCPPSLFHGVWIPGGGADTNGLVPMIAAATGRPVPVIQTYRGTRSADDRI